MMLRKPEYFISGNGVGGGGSVCQEYSRVLILLWQTVPESDTSVQLPAAG